MRDVIDFEYLLARYRGELPVPEDAGAIEKFSGPGGERRSLLHQWLEWRREKEEDALPGRHFAASWQVLLVLGLIGGLLLGTGVTLGHLSYETSEPINLAKFLLWTVGLQWVFLVLAAFLWLFRRAIPDLREFYPLHALLWTIELGLKRLPGEQRDGLRAAVGRVRHHREIYGSLMVWPTLIITQLFAVAFNLAVIGTTLLIGQVQDLRFGWQTTPDVTPQQAHERVELFALPWMWAPAGVPTVDQVAKSRYAPGQDLAELDVAATRAWWPFVIYSVAFYGLLVRGAFLLHAIVRLRRQLGQIRFDHAEASALFRRLSGPIMRPENSPEPLRIPSIKAAEVAPHVRKGAALVLVAADTGLPPEVSGGELLKPFGWEHAGQRTVEIDRPKSNAEVMTELRSRSGELAAVVVVVRSKRPPIRAIALVLEEVKQAAGASCELVLLLVGRSGDADFLPVSAEEFTHWQNFNAIHGLHLGVEKWNL